MEEKLLTVIVPTYNMDFCLEENLKSYLVPEAEKSLCVTVLDNSSSDGSFEIAEKYERLYPKIFRAIRKENRGYGSSVNLGIKIARSRYIKVVDADDSVNPRGLSALLSALEASDADVVLTPYTERDFRSGAETAAAFPFSAGESLTPRDLKKRRPLPSIFTSTYKTELLRENGITLLENAYFADEELALYPFFFAKSISAVGASVTKYTVNREGQSVSPENKIRLLSDREAVLKRMLDFYEGAKIPTENEDFAKSRLALSLGNHLTTLYILHPERQRGRRLAKEFSEYLKLRNLSFYKMINKKRTILSLLNFFGVSDRSFRALKERFLRR